MVAGEWESEGRVDEGGLHILQVLCIVKCQWEGPGIHPVTGSRMTNAGASPSTPEPGASPDDVPGMLRESAGWWEPRRLHYNVVLTAVFIALAVRTWSRFRPELTTAAIAPLVVLALLANLCYSAAYLLDVPLLELPHPTRTTWRWSIWTAGTLTAVLIESYWFLDEILPPPV